MRLLCAFLLSGAALAAQTPNLAGDWTATITRYGDPDYTRLHLEDKDGKISGKIWGDVKLDGTAPLRGSFKLDCSYEDDDKKTKPCGSLSLTVNPAGISGHGTLFDDPLDFSARRESSGSTTPQVHEFVPTKFYRQFSGSTKPVLHVNSGDTIKTKCVDAGGVDSQGKHRSLGGNPLTGPFYIEGAMPGDTLAITLNRVRLNRDSAGIFDDTVVGSAVDPYYFRDMKRVKDFDSSWKLDREKGVAMLTKPTDRLRNFQVQLRPMMGCVGVAPPGNQAFRSGDLGPYGGNMDYNQLQEGATLYLPVFQPGAILFIGDGHATQGDGELTGNALETSMDVEFTVRLIRGKSLGQPRIENGEFVMVSGIAGSLNDALQDATTGLSHWLEDEYKLNPGEIAMLLGSSMHYDIAEVVDPKVHIVAKLPKALLNQIAKSE